jgi:hypothetical protein
MSWLLDRIDKLSEQHTKKVTQLTEYLQGKGFTVRKYTFSYFLELDSEDGELSVDINFGDNYKTINVQLKKDEDYKLVKLNLLAPDIILEFKAKVDELIVDVLFS